MAPAVADAAVLDYGGGAVGKNSSLPGSRHGVDGRERFRRRVDGRFVAGGVTGTLRITSVMWRGSNRMDRCDTGDVGFNAQL